MPKSVTNLTTNVYYQVPPFSNGNQWLIGIIRLFLLSMYEFLKDRTGGLILDRNILQANKNILILWVFRIFFWNFQEFSKKFRSFKNDPKNFFKFCDFSGVFMSFKDFQVLLGNILEFLGVFAEFFKILY
jgi:hypothetical protein